MLFSIEKVTPSIVVVLAVEVAVAEVDEIVPEAVPELEAEPVVVPLVRPEEDETAVDKGSEEETPVEEA